jgi:hypothetical protein
MGHMEPTRAQLTTASTLDTTYSRLLGVERTRLLAAADAMAADAAAARGLGPRGARRALLQDLWEARKARRGRWLKGSRGGGEHVGGRVGLRRMGGAAHRWWASTAAC